MIAEQQKQIAALAANLKEQAAAIRKVRAQVAADQAKLRIVSATE